MRHIIKTIVITIVSIFVAPHLVIASGDFTPHIINHGSYKEVAVPEGQDLVALLGHVPPDVQNATFTGPLEDMRELNVSLVLSLNQEDELHNFLQYLSEPNTHIRQFLSSDEWMARFAPNPYQVQNIIAYLTANGLAIEGVAANNLVIKARGPVHVLNRVFNTEIHSFIDAHGKEFYAPAYELQVDSALKIVSVLGLENRTKLHSHHKILKNPTDAHPNFWQSGPMYGLTPAVIQSAYQIPGTATGSGQTLALFELDGFTMSDILAYESAFSLPQVPIQVVLIDGFNGSAGSGAGEVTLDIELMIAAAPNASKIMVYEGPNTAQGVIDTYNQIAIDNAAKSVSTSWGLSETYTSGAFVQAENQIFMQMAAQGQTIYAAAGDAGAYDNGTTLSVDDPASQPLVSGVGGTRLSVDSFGNYVSETTWSYAFGPGEGGGGGISTFWSLPTWQQGFSNASNLASSTMRNVPDVSMDADPETGYAIYFNGQWQVFGGTSCGAPLWAAFNALVNQNRANNSLAPLGFANPSLYQIGQGANYATSFHDVADNSNNGFYPAVQGYDLATGLGSFIGGSLINALTQGSLPTCVQANPTVSLSPSSQSGQAGSTLNYTLSVTNNDSSACASSRFNLSYSVPSGFSAALQQSSVNLQPGQTTQIGVSVTSSNSTSPGTYSFTLTAQNQSFPSYASSVQGAYVIQASALSISISPQNPQFKRPSNAQFQITLTNGQSGVPNNPVDILVTGPQTWVKFGTTDSNGVYKYSFQISKTFTTGTYQLKATSSYQGTTVSTTTSFVVK